MKQVKKSDFTLIELLVKRSHLNCNHADGSKDGYSPVCRQVKQYCFTCLQTGEAVLLHFEKKVFLVPRTLIHFNRIARCYRHYRYPGSDFAARIEQCQGTRQKHRLRQQS